MNPNQHQQATHGMEAYLYSCALSDQPSPRNLLSHPSGLGGCKAHSSNNSVQLGPTQQQHRRHIQPPLAMKLSVQGSRSGRLSIVAQQTSVPLHTACRARLLHATAVLARRCMSGCADARNWSCHSRCQRVPQAPGAALAQGGAAHSSQQGSHLQNNQSAHTALVAGDTL